MSSLHWHPWRPSIIRIICLWSVQKIRKRCGIIVVKVEWGTDTDIDGICPRDWCCLKEALAPPPAPIVLLTAAITASLALVAICAGLSALI